MSREFAPSEDNELNEEDMNVGDEPDMSGPEWELPEMGGSELVFESNEMADFAENINKMWGKEAMEDGWPEPVSDRAELLALLSGIKLKYVRNETRYEKFLQACKLAEKLACNIEFGDSGSTGHIVIKDTSIIAANKKQFASLLSLADEAKMYPTVDGRACISLRFFGLRSAKPDILHTSLAAITFRNDKNNTADFRAARSRRLVKRGNGGVPCRVKWQKERNLLTMEEHSISIDDTWSFAIAVNSADGARIEPSDDGKARLTLEFEKKKG